MIVLNLLIRLDGGGAERSVAQLVSPLRELGVRSLRLAINPSRPGEECAPDWTILSADHSQSPAAILKSTLVLRRKILQLKPDILHLHCESPEIVGLLAVLTVPKRRRPKLVRTEHTTIPWRGKEPIGKIVRKGLKKLSCATSSCFDPPLIDGTRVIPNPVSAKVALRNPASVSLTANIVVIGRLIPSKRVQDIFAAAAQAEWQGGILVIGDGEERRALELLAEELNLSATFLGFQADPWSHVSDRDIFVSASIMEGEPLTLLEAIKRSVPIIASNIVPHSRLLGAHKGIFNSNKDLVELLTDVATTDSGDRYVLDSKRRNEVITARQPRNVAEQWARYYQEIVGPR